MDALEECQRVSRMIQSLQNARDYAAPEKVPYFTAAIEYLLDIAEACGGRLGEWKGIKSR